MLLVSARKINNNLFDIRPRRVGVCSANEEKGAKEAMGRKLRRELVEKLILLKPSLCERTGKSRANNMASADIPFHRYVVQIALKTEKAFMLIWIPKRAILGPTTTVTKMLS